MTMTIEPAAATTAAAPALMDEFAAAWVMRNVLGLTGKKAAEQAWYLAKSACQWGPCGHCDAGRHHMCAHRRDGGARPGPSSDTHITHRRNGHVVSLRVGERTIYAAVYLAGHVCVWVCPCPVCVERDQQREQLTEPEAVLELPPPRRYNPDQGLLF